MIYPPLYYYGVKHLLQICNTILCKSTQLKYTFSGHTLREYIRSIRLETAKRLIEEGQLNISEIAYETGFSSPAHFSRTFKRFYGKSPSELK